MQRLDRLVWARLRIQRPPQVPLRRRRNADGLRKLVPPLKKRAVELVLRREREMLLRMLRPRLLRRFRRSGVARASRARRRSMRTLWSRLRQRLHRSVGAGRRRTSLRKQEQRSLKAEVEMPRGRSRRGHEHGRRDRRSIDYGRNNERS